MARASGRTVPRVAGPSGAAESLRTYPTPAGCAGARQADPRAVRHLIVRTARTTSRCRIYVRLWELMPLPHKPRPAERLFEFRRASDARSGDSVDHAGTRLLDGVAVAAVLTIAIGSVIVRWF